MAIKNTKSLVTKIEETGLKIIEMEKHGVDADALIENINTMFQSLIGHNLKHFTDTTENKDLSKFVELVESLSSPLGFRESHRVTGSAIETFKKNQIDEFEENKKSIFYNSLNEDITDFEINIISAKYICSSNYTKYINPYKKIIIDNQEIDYWSDFCKRYACFIVDTMATKV